MSKGHRMTSLTKAPMAQLLDTLHEQAEAADHDFMSGVMARLQASGATIEEMAAQWTAQEQGNYRATYRDHAEHFLAISPAYGRFLYAIARACKAKRIVEFGTSMGVSTLYLAAALRDNGGGQLIGSELEPGKVKRARANIEAAGLADLVDIREGDALETLKDVGGTVAMMLVDGAWSLYLPVLKMVEPYLAPGAPVLGENAFAADYLAYVRDPAHGYLSYALAIDEGRGNEFTVRVG
jgi:predicted O-methyltransferase YrrM